MSAEFGFLIDDLYLAYRKAKAEAFYENTHFHAIAYVEYERELDRNLRKLLSKLTSKSSSWSSDREMLSGFTYAPKSVSIETNNEEDKMFFRFLDPLEEWHRNTRKAQGKRVEADFRLMISPTVDFQVVSALWIMAVGHLFDSALDPAVCYGNRVRRRRSVDMESELGDINLDCIGLFPPYFSAYSRWRQNGLDAMTEALKGGDRVIALTMDLRSFYHRVSPRFLLRNRYLETIGVALTPPQQAFTARLVEALETWYSTTPDFKRRPEGGLPVGLSASKIIANALLAELDKLIVRKVKPVYYGRYVDDLFLVLRSDYSVDTAKAVMQQFASSLPDVLSWGSDARGGEMGIRLRLKYARDSDLFFSGKKQKIFNLAGKHGLDLVTQVAAQIRQHSSEHRLLPTVPSTSVDMASRALLAQSNATLEADAIRKADVVSVRRLGLSFLLRDVEAYARDLNPKEWTDRRNEFYGLIHRHVLTPTGFFDFFAYTTRALGLMISCGDFEDANKLLRRLAKIISILESTTTAGTSKRREFAGCRSYYARALMQVILQSTSSPTFKWPRVILRIFNTLHLIDPDVTTPSRLDAIKRISLNLLYSDLGRRPYRDLWLSGALRKLPNPPVPSALSLKRLFRLGAIRAFRRLAGLRLPYWPALIFPTRPLTLSELTLAAPQLLAKPHFLRASLFAFRGARARNHEGVVSLESSVTAKNTRVLVDGIQKRRYRIAIPSFLTKNAEWAAAADGTPQLTLARYERVIGIVNRILQESKNVDYVVFPECSLPFPWAKAIARKLSDRRTSLIAGLEYRVTATGVRNDVFLSLATEWPWHSTSVLLLQPKSAPAHEERRGLYKHGRKRLFRPLGIARRPPIYVHGGFSFAVMLCSDLTSIALRGPLQGAIDGLFVLEWNKDIDTFSALVEATANDLHAYVIQSNNRKYGDSRVRIPRKKDYQRDVVRVRGGSHDYFVTAAIDVGGLRSFQSHSPTTSKGPFKPTPIGYVMTDWRSRS